MAYKLIHTNCPHCKGSGLLHIAAYTDVDCPHCRGKGIIITKGETIKDCLRI